MYSGITYLDFAAADAVLHFNDGNCGQSTIFQHMGLEVNKHSNNYIEEFFLANGRYNKENNEL